MAIQNKALLIKMTAKVFSPSKKDKNETMAVANKHNIDNNRINVSKKLLRSDTLKKITSVKNKLNNYLFDKEKGCCLPWSSLGSILPTALYIDTVKKIDDIKNEFSELVKEFIENEYEKLVKADSGYDGLNSLYNPADYPSKSELYKKFKLQVDFFEIPTGNDFRIDLNQDEIDILKNQIEEKNKEANKKITEECFRRLYTQIKKLSDKFKTDEKYHSSILDNIKNLCGILPALNINNDAVLQNQIDIVKKELFNHSIDAIKKDVEKKKEVQEKAENIVNNMSAFA